LQLETHDEDDEAVEVDDLQIGDEKIVIVVLQILR